MKEEINRSADEHVTINVEHKATFIVVHCFIMISVEKAARMYGLNLKEQEIMF